MSGDRWPALALEDWEPTKQTLHRYAQIAGKVRMALVPSLNHWWHVTLYTSARGLTTAAMPAGDVTAEIEFDFVEHRLAVRTSAGRSAGFALRDRLPCARFYTDLFAALREVGVEVEILAKPYDLGDDLPFAEDLEHDSYDPDAVGRYWRILRSTTEVMGTFASRFNGKASPGHLFWHSFDIAYARFSGRPAPPIEGADPVTAEAYSHEIAAFGWWPGDRRRTPFPAFYSYTSPEPAGLAERPLEPPEVAWQDTGNGSLAVLPYDAVRESADPDATLLAFFESAYLAGARLAGWDVDALRRA